MVNVTVVAVNKVHFKKQYSSVATGWREMVVFLNRLSVVLL